MTPRKKSIDPLLLSRGFNMSYAHYHIRYTTGTGNSRRVALWMAERARGLGAEAALSTMEEPLPAGAATPGGGNLLGFIFPTHGFTAPWHVITRTLALPRGGGAHAFVAATRAGSKIGSLFLPGIAGSGPFLIALILACKGYRVRGVTAFDMPSNWMSLHSAYKPDTQRSIIERTGGAVRSFVDRLAGGRSVWFTLNNLYEAVWTVLLSFISLLYLLVGRFCLAKIFFANNRCNGCGQCAEHCPLGAIRMEKTRHGDRPYWRHTCESCMRCMGYCPTKAIEASHLAVAFLVFVTIFPAVPLMASVLSALIPGFDILTLPGGWWALYTLYTYPLIYITGFLLRFLSRIRPVNTLLTLATGTHYYRRYHEPGTKLKELGGK